LIGERWWSELNGGIIPKGGLKLGEKKGGWDKGNSKKKKGHRKVPKKRRGGNLRGPNLINGWDRGGSKGRKKTHQKKKKGVYQGDGSHRENMCVIGGRKNYKQNTGNGGKIP